MESDWLSIFNWLKLKHVESLLETGNDLDVDFKLQKLIKEEVDCYNHGRVCLLINQNSVPRFIKIRHISFCITISGRRN